MYQEDFDKLLQKVDRLTSVVEELASEQRRIYHSKEYTRKQAAEALGMSLRWLDALKAAGKIGHIDNDGKITFTQKHLDEYRAHYDVPAKKSLLK